MSSAESHTLVIGLGGNLGDTAGFLQRSVDLLGGALQITARSSLYHTTPYGDPNQADFINAVVAGTTTLAPLDFLRRLQQVEQTLGKRPIRPNGPRCIDLDLLFWGNRVLKLPGLVVPHPRAHLRDFVLLPLLEILPEFHHPVCSKSIRELVGDLPESERHFTGRMQSWPNQ